MEKKTPLYDLHVSSGGKMVHFAGFLLPVSYGTGIIAEHKAVRTAAGIFDVSHMGEIVFTGSGAFNTIQHIFTNDFTDLKEGGMRYTLMCDETGGVLDDIIIYKYSDEKYMAVVNASNVDKDFEWISSHLLKNTECENISESIAQIALQGPESKKILLKIAKDPDLLPEKPYTFIEDTELSGIPCLVSESGYTGEEGYEIYCSTGDASNLWEKILDAGKDKVIPCGLGARDTLRLEASMPLYGHELSLSIDPFEAALGRYVKMEKPDFLGKSSLEGKKEPLRKRTGIEITGKGIARENCEVFDGDKKIGTTTSGTMCPFIGKAVAMALLDTVYAVPGKEIQVEVRGRMLSAKTVKMPFYKRANKA
jgi:aminomethyltransferase